MPDADRCVCCGEIVPEGRQWRIYKNGATNTLRKHTHRTFLRSFQKRRATQTEPHLYAEKESTAETAITRELAIDAGTNRWRNNNG